MDMRIGCGIFGGNESSPQPNSKYGGFLDSSGSLNSPEIKDNSTKRRRSMDSDDDLSRAQGHA